MWSTRRAIRQLNRAVARGDTHESNAVGRGGSPAGAAGDSKLKRSAVVADRRENV